MQLLAQIDLEVALEKTDLEVALEKTDLVLNGRRIIFKAFYDGLKSIDGLKHQTADILLGSP